MSASPRSRRTRRAGFSRPEAPRQRLGQPEQLRPLQQRLQSQRAGRRSARPSRARSSTTSAIASGWRECSSHRNPSGSRRVMPSSASTWPGKSCGVEGHDGIGLAAMAMASTCTSFGVGQQQAAPRSPAARGSAPAERPRAAVPPRPSAWAWATGPSLAVAASIRAGCGRTRPADTAPPPPRPAGFRAGPWGTARRRPEPPSCRSVQPEGQRLEIAAFRQLRQHRMIRRRQSRCAGSAPAARPARCRARRRCGRLDRSAAWEHEHKTR